MTLYYLYKWNTYTDKKASYIEKAIGPQWVKINMHHQGKPGLGVTGEPSNYLPLKFPNIL